MGIIPERLGKIEGHENYCATVINLPPKVAVEGLDNLVKVTVFGNDCLIGKDSDETIPYLFIPAEAQLSGDFLKNNNLYRDATLNADPSKKGFFEPTGRVKAIKFKGVISTGFVTPLSTLDALFPEGLTVPPGVGEEFHSVWGRELCRKYRIIRMQGSGDPKNRHNRKLERFDRLVPNQFRFHTDTAHLSKNLHHFHPGDTLVITDKWHGTSAVYANVLVKKELTWKERLAKWLGVDVVETKYDNLYASRTVIKNKYINKLATSGFYKEDVWKVVENEVKEKVEPGITLYGEIVGFLPSGRAIQKGYDYGCPPPEVLVDANGVDIKTRHKFVVYRITYTKPDGNVIEFTWQQVHSYCRKYQLETVKLLYYGPAALLALTRDEDQFRRDLYDYLVNTYLEGDCKYCLNKVPAEGICVRIDGREDYSTYKLKSKRFLERETKELDSGETNIEEEQEEVVE